MTQSNPPVGDPTLAPWPEKGLEPVSSCPVCGGGERELVHHGLRDRVFRCAPGEWNLQRCSSCGTGYLSPRPNAETIGLAYAQYFTHTMDVGTDAPPRSAWRRHRVAQRNAYLNQQYGYRLSPARARVPRWVSTARRQRWDKHVGFLGYPGKGARLLDVGCGHGRFLMQMRAVGWEVSGIEPDPKSAARAVAAGLDARTGTMETTAMPQAHFDAVTMNHVVEHLHRPVETLKRCWQVLKPGGVIAIATPNFAAYGHRLFGPDWMPLDPPRHLVLFTPESLRLALESAGFQPEPSLRLRLCAAGIFRGCLQVRRGLDSPRQTPPMQWMERLRAIWLARPADRETRANPGLTEELVLLARRPKSRTNPN